MKLSDIGQAAKNLFPKLRYLWFIAVVLMVSVFALAYIAGRTTASRMPSAQVMNAPAATDTVQETQDYKSPNDKASQTSKARLQTVANKGTRAPGMLELLIGALVASFILAAFIPLNHKELDWKARQVFLVGSLIAVVSIALILGSFYLSDEEPSNKTAFLVAAEFVAIALLVLAVCYVPRFVRALQGIRSVFLKISVLLCFAGAAGGFAYHLVSHKGNLIMPELGVWEEEESSSVKGDDAVAKPSKHPNTVINASRPPSEKDNLPRERIKRKAFHIGFIGDVLLGLIAANALHLALASLVKYDAKDEDKRGHYFTFLALGILSGFAGAKVLTTGAEQVYPEKVREIVREEVGQNSKPDASPDQIIVLPRSTEIAKAVTDTLTRFEWPSEDQLLQMKNFAAIVKDTKKPVEKFTTDELLAAAGSELFVNTSSVASETISKYAGVLVDKPDVPRAQGWAARVLRALSVLLEGTRSARIGWYPDAQTDLSQLFFDAASSEQRSVGALFANFASFAAIITHEPEQPDRQAISRRLEWGSSGAKGRAKRAIALARQVDQYLKDGTLPQTTPPAAETARTTPSATSQSPIPGASGSPQVSVSSASAIPSQASNVAENRIPLLRLVTTMKAIPKEFLASLMKSSDADKDALSTLIEAAPSYPIKPSSPTTTSTPSRAPASGPVDLAPSSGDKSNTVATPTPSAGASPAPTVDPNVFSTETPKPTPSDE